VQRAYGYKRLNSTPVIFTYQEMGMYWVRDFVWRGIFGFEFIDFAVGETEQSEVWGSRVGQ
jgi:hypothetical protein